MILRAGLVDLRHLAAADIVRFDNLDDDGVGSLRWALRQSSPKRVEPEPGLAGTIYLKTPLRSTFPDTLLDGGGITLSNFGLHILGDRTYFGNLRHVLSVRNHAGQVLPAPPCPNCPKTSGDNFSIKAQDVIGDRLYGRRATDESVSLETGRPTRVSLIRSIFGDVLEHGTHEYGDGQHSRGFNAASCVGLYVGSCYLVGCDRRLPHLVTRDGDPVMQVVLDSVVVRSWGSAAVHFAGNVELIANRMRFEPGQRSTGALFTFDDPLGVATRPKVWIGRVENPGRFPTTAGSPDVFVSERPFEPRAMGWVMVRDKRIGPDGPKSDYERAILQGEEPKDWGEPSIRASLDCATCLPVVEAS